MERIFSTERGRLPEVELALPASPLRNDVRVTLQPRGLPLPRSRRARRSQRTLTLPITRSGEHYVAAVPRDLTFRHRRDPALAVFLFPTSSEVRPIKDLPAPGTRVRSSSGHVWTVSQTLQSGRQTFTIVCVSHDQYREEQPQDDIGADLANELLLRARDVASSAKHRWRRWKNRHYLP